MSERNPPAPRTASAPAALETHLAALIPGATLVPTPLPLAPSLRLWLLGPTVPAGPLAPEAAAQLQDTPPYWAFCWASGHALAAEILEGRVSVQGRRVIDFGAGSGVVALAAALSGAREVYAVDEDPQALAALEANAALNGVEMALSDDLEACLAEADCVSAADILYDRDNLPLLERFHRSGLPILLADSRIPDLDPPGLTLLGTWQASTWPDLGEAGEYNRVRIFASEP